MPSIDILLPFHGNPGYLKLAVESVRQQKDEDWRMLVFDDADPAELSSWFGDLHDDRIVYQRNPTNLGANANYRLALSQATADYVVFMGADDIMLPSYVTTIRETLTAFPGVTIVQPGVQVVDEHGRRCLPPADRVKMLVSPKCAEPRVYSGEVLAASLLRGNWTYFPSLTFQRDQIARIGFRPDLGVTQDLALLLDVIYSGGTLAINPRSAFIYRRHAASDSAIRTLEGQRFREEREVFQVARDSAISHGWPKAALSARWHITSRIHAASILPSAVAHARWDLIPELTRHVFGS